MRSINIISEESKAMISGSEIVDDTFGKFLHSFNCAFSRQDYGKMEKICGEAIAALKENSDHVASCYLFQGATFYLKGKKGKAKSSFEVAFTKANEKDKVIFKNNLIELLITPSLRRKNSRLVIDACNFLLELFKSYPIKLKDENAIQHRILLLQADAYLLANQVAEAQMAVKEAQELSTGDEAKAFVDEILHQNSQEDEVDHLEEKMSISLEELTKEMIETNKVILMSRSMIKQLETDMRQAEKEEVKSLASSVSSSAKPELSSRPPVAQKKLVPVPHVLPPKLTGKLSNAERERRKKEKQLEKKKEKERNQLLQQQQPGKKLEKENKSVKIKNEESGKNIAKKENITLKDNYEFLKTLLPQKELAWLGDLHTKLTPLNKSLQITGEFAAACAIYVYTKQTVKINHIHLLVAQQDEAKTSSISETDSVIVKHGFEGAFSDASSSSNYSCLRTESLEQTPYQYMLTLPFRTEYKPPFDPLGMNGLHLTIDTQSASANLSFPLRLNKNLFFNLKDSNNFFHNACNKREFKSQLPTAEEKCVGMFFKIHDWKKRTQFVLTKYDSETRKLLSLNNNNWATQFFIQELFKKPSFGSSGVFNFSCYYQIVALMRHPDFSGIELKATIHAFCQAVLFAKQYKEKFPGVDLSIMSNQVIREAVRDITLNPYMLDNMTKVIQRLYHQPIFKKWNDRELHKHLVGVMEEMCKDNGLSKLLSPEDLTAFVKKHTAAEKLIEQKEQVSSVNLKKGK